MKSLKKAVLAAAAAAFLLFGTAFTAFAGQWLTTPDGSWAYEENGVFLTGWQKIDNVWYYLSPQTCLWVEHPDLTVESAPYLLENAVNEAGWYANEKYVMHYVVDGWSNSTITVSIKLETAPDELYSTLNTFVIDRRTRVAQAVTTKLNLQLE